MTPMRPEPDKVSWEEKFISRFLSPALAGVVTLVLLLGMGFYLPHFGA